MIRDRYLEDALRQLRKYKQLAERAIAQVSDQQLFTALDGGGNSIAIIMKHMAGNMRSRWTDFLTSDGEKPDRHRDTEFENHGETAADMQRIWEAGWEVTIAAISELEWQDLERDDLRVLTATSLDESPSLAPNGTMLIYATQDRGRGILAVVSIDGRVKYRLPSSSGDVREPAWSPYIDVLGSGS